MVIGGETDGVRRLRDEGLESSTWGNGPGDRYAAHEHAYDKVIVVREGSIRFGLTGLGRAIELATGDRLELPAGTSHDATVGPNGVTCLEAHVPAGTFSEIAARATGTW
jgi:quercetin dioxygenase-like cupin family protein